MITASANLALVVIGMGKIVTLFSKLEFIGEVCHECGVRHP